LEAGAGCLRLQPKSEVPFFAFQSHITVLHYFLLHPNPQHNYTTQKTKNKRKKKKNIMGVGLIHIPL